MPTKEWCMANKERIRAYKAKWRSANKEKLREKSADYYALNKVCINERLTAYYAANPDKYKEMRNKYYETNRSVVIERSAAWRIGNPEKRASFVSAWSKANPEKRSSKEARRRASKMSAAPAWADDFIISEMYELCKLRTKTLGSSWHVDHIVPLKSPLVCGLHVENNLRVVPSILNIKKSNRFWPDMPDADGQREFK